MPRIPTGPTLAGAFAAALAAALFLGVAAVGRANTQAGGPYAGSVYLDEGPATWREVPPDAWLQSDPADSLYRVGQRALANSRFREALAAFDQITSKYPKSGYAADALYWQAFSLYRIGGTANLRSARERLTRQEREFPTAATRGDAAALATRIRGELARQGDAQAAAELRQQLDQLGATAPAAPVAPSAPEAPVAPSAERAPRVPRAPRPDRVRNGHSRDECKDEDDVRMSALNALLQMDAERAMPTLEKVLARRDSGSVCLRRRAVFVVAQHHTDRTEAILLNAARQDPDTEVRQQAVFWLSEVPTETAVAALDSILRGSNDDEVKERAIFALSQHDSDRAQQILRGYAMRNDAPRPLRERAIFWLHEEDTPENAAFLRELYTKLDDAELKERVIFSISQMDTPGATGWLLDVAKNPRENIELRKKALFWAGESGVTIAELAQLYGTLSDRELKEQLIFVLSQRDEPAALDKLMDIARRDSDTELRKKALFWIGESDDPRAAKFLQDILEQP